MSGSKLTKREREWAFKLEEALYNNDNKNDNNSSSGGRFGSRLFNRGSSSVNVNVNGSSSSSSSKTNSKSSNTLLYGKPSDLEIAAHAIRSKGNISKSLKRIRRLKQFKTMYQISDFNGTSSENGSDETQTQTHENNNENNNEQIITRIVTIMKKVFLVAYPNFIQKIGIDKHNRVVIMFRLCELRWTESPPFNHNNMERFQALYYLLWCIQPTLDSIRMGTVWIGDLQDIELGSTTTSSSSSTNGVNNSNNIVTTTTTTTIVKPTSEIYIGGRLLLRDSYPIKVDDICVIDSPSKISKLYLYLYPFLSNHFLSKFVGVTSSQLQQHFSSELLSPRILNLKNNNSSSNSKKVYGVGGGGRNNRNRNNNKRNNNHHHHHNNSEEEENDDDWENLGDSSNSETNDDDHNNNVNADVDEDEDNKPKLVTINVNDNDNDNDNVNNNSVVVSSSSSDNSGNENDENEDSSLLLLWTTIERLVRIRFDTERHFRL